MRRGVIVEVLPSLLDGVLHLYEVVGHFHLEGEGEGGGGEGNGEGGEKERKAYECTNSVHPPAV